MDELPISLPASSSCDSFAPDFAVWQDLRIFCLLGNAFRDGATSLRNAADMVLTRQEAGIVPVEIRCSKSNASRVLFRLAEKVFGPRYGRPHLSLLSYSDGEAAHLSNVGQRAYDETCEFLVRHGLLPQW